MNHDEYEDDYKGSEETLRMIGEHLAQRHYTIKEVLDLLSSMILSILLEQGYPQTEFQAVLDKLGRDLCL